MSQAVMIAFSGSMKCEFLVDALRALATYRSESFSLYRPTRVSKSACSESITVWLGDSGLSKEPMPEQIDVLVGLEELEGRRNARYLKKEGMCVLCSVHRLPMPVAVGTVGYPNDILYRMVFEGRKVYQIRRVEVTPLHVICATLRALGCTQEECKAVLNDREGIQEAIEYAYALPYAK